MCSCALAFPLALPLLLLVVGPQGCAGERYSRGAAPPEAGQFNGTLYAACRVRPSARLPEGLPKVYGLVLFRQEGPRGPLQALFHLGGFPAASAQLRAVHVHQLGDLSEGCDSTGGHYNPHGSSHPAHPGDFGNLAPRGGRVRERREAGGATLFGGLSLLGRAVVLHEGQDDLGRGGDAGSLLHGNAGRRLACCVIGISAPKLWDRIEQRQRRTANQEQRQRRTANHEQRQRRTAKQGRQ